MVPRTLCASLSKKGWDDSEQFQGLPGGHFIKHATGARPLFLLLDGGSHHLIWFAKEHGVVLFCLTPHTTHESQPLQVYLAKPLKQIRMTKNPGRVIISITTLDP